jgi:hypothetical protein
MAKTVIAIPTRDAYVHSRLIKNILPQLQNKEGDNLLLIVAGVSPIAHARNKIVEGFLSTDATHLWMVDADTIPPPDALEKLLKVGKPVVTGITPILKDNHTVSNIFSDLSGNPLSMDEIGIHAKKGENLIVKGCGASCLLIERSVIEKLSVPYFAELWDEDGRYLTEDIYFSNTLGEAKIDITCIPTIRCGHAKQVIL